MTKDEAIQIAKELEIEMAVRVVAKAGRPEDSNGINYINISRGFTCRSTFGAGTNSSSVKLDNLTVYKSLDYGRHIEIFRFGQWCHDLVEMSKNIDAINQAEEIIKIANDEAEELSRFQPIGDSEV